MAQSVQQLGPDRAGSRAAWPAESGDRGAVAAIRPFGLSVLALAALITGVVLLLWALAWFGASDIVAGTRLATLARVVVFGLLVAAALEVAIAYGVWTLRPWAWKLGVAVGIASIVLTLLGAGRGTQDAHLLTLLLEAGAVWYLLTPKVHDLFDPSRRGTND